MLDLIENLSRRHISPASLPVGFSKSTRGIVKCMSMRSRIGPLSRFLCVETHVYMHQYSGGPEETWAIKGEEQQVQNVSPKDAVIGFGDHKCPAEQVRANLDTDVGHYSLGLIAIVCLEQDARRPNRNAECLGDCPRDDADIRPGVKQHAYICNGLTGTSYGSSGASS